VSHLGPARVTLILILYEKLTFYGYILGSSKQGLQKCGCLFWAEAKLTNFDCDEITGQYAEQ
jgi:hypothetical protein